MIVTNAPVSSVWTRREGRRVRKEQHEYLSVRCSGAVRRWSWSFLHRTARASFASLYEPLLCACASCASSLIFSQRPAIHRLVSVSNSRMAISVRISMSFSFILIRTMLCSGYVADRRVSRTTTVSLLCDPVWNIGCCMLLTVVLFCRLDRIRPLA